MNVPAYQPGEMQAPIENLLHRQSAKFRLRPAAVQDAAAAFARAGGSPSTGPAGAYLPSGASLASWIEDQAEVSPHWFEPAPVAAPAPKPKRPAALRLADANGDAKPRL